MHPLFKVVPIFSYSLAALLPLTLVQAQVPNQTCQTILENDRYNLNWYPVKPLSEFVATDPVARQLNELEAIALSPSSLDLAVQERLILWLTEKPDPGGADIGRAAQMNELLKILPNSQKPQLIAIFDQLANRIERLPSRMERALLTGRLADYYQQLERTDRAALLLNRAIGLALKSTNVQARTVQLTKLLDAVVELGLSKAIAPQLPKIKAALLNTPTLSLARAYADTNQLQLALLEADRVAKATPTKDLNSPNLIRLYLQLNQPSRASVYLKGFPPDDDASYGRLVAAYDRAKQPAIADKLFKEGFYPLARALFVDRFLSGYLKAGGNPDRLFVGLPTLEGVGIIDLREKYLLRSAGEYRRRNQPQKAQRAIAQFVQLAVSKNVDLETVLMAAIKNGYLPEAKTAFEQLLAGNAFTKIEPPINFAAQINALDAIAPFVQRSKNPDRRIELLQSLAIAYAEQQQADKAVSIAQKIPRRSPDYSSAIDTLAKVATVFAKSGQKTQATMIFDRASNLSSSIKEVDTRAQAYAAIARAYTNAGETAAAEKSRQTAVKWASSLPTVTANNMLLSISQQFLDANQVEAAWKTLQEIPRDSEIYQNLHIDSWVSVALETGNLSIAQQAFDLRDVYKEQLRFIDPTSLLIKAYLDRDRPLEAIKILDLVAKYINNQKEPNLYLMISTAEFYAKAGRIDAARQLMKKIPNPTPYGLSWQEIQQNIDCYEKSLL
ncbi:hypothetical protein [Calothrix sp. CCY 0018]|uniref:hypothetical protein n=1 Tax=Calothrix sp. CCY 0018 TaxID=3103864 RepID=UPI0039C68B02